MDPLELVIEIEKHLFVRFVQVPNSPFQEPHPGFSPGRGQEVGVTASGPESWDCLVTVLFVIQHNRGEICGQGTNDDQAGVTFFSRLSHPASELCIGTGPLQDAVVGDQFYLIHQDNPSHIARCFDEFQHEPEFLRGHVPGQRGPELICLVLTNVPEAVPHALELNAIP